MEEGEEPVQRILLLTAYEPFDLRLEFGETEPIFLEWQETTLPSKDGRSWRVRERGGEGYCSAQIVRLGRGKRPVWAGELLMPFGLARNHSTGGRGIS